MVFAIAALLFQIGPALPAVPAAASSAASAASSAVSAKANAAPAPTPASDLPEAPLPSIITSAHSAAPANESASNTPATSDRLPVVIRTASLNAANDPQTLSTIHIPDSNSKPLERIGVEAIPSYRKWLALSIAQSSAAAFDAYGTRRALSNGAYEADPLMRPFAGSSGIYAAIQVAPLVLDYTAKRMQRSEAPFVRHTWWLPQAMGTGLYLFSGAHDLQVASHH
jgi:hypothetical protein